ncbi:DNA polymerase III subunit delta [Arthrobacter crystallopoietes]|uniref:DNA-directed DNA polymerase n=1 Tax=Crystallibacter crystallopoietes TaxID=37928 RepID=A0A1H1GGV4_9MICC|nr:DNA polymerase III subunit delta [Arthrobacter crystallopoietes]AUI52579.1 DNA polymerase III subunit delta [Arthrobacter crystallopoietes]SDR12329.1 DNA polymerase III, delta subunit [Arthrobacter crystallopoietes]
MNPPPARPAAGSKTAGRTVSWREVEPAPVVLISGPEEYLAHRARDRIRSLTRGIHPDVELTTLEAASYASGQLTMIASPSLFGESKLVEVDGVAQMNDEFLADALVYLQAPAEDVTLVLHHSGGVRGKKLLDAIKASGAPVVDCQAMKKDSDKLDFVRREFKAARRGLDPAAGQALVSAVGASLPDLAAACAQLISDVQGTVTEETVEKYYGGRVEATGFKVADAAVSGRGAVALSTLRHALATGVDPVPIVAVLAMKLRQIAKVKGASVSAKDAGLAPWQFDQARKDARNWDSAALAACIQMLAETDAQVKGAARDPEYAVERAVTVIAASVGH